jgi:ribulose-phosphate 3-epimerase
MFRQAETFTSYVQLDIMDGQFVPSHSVSSEDLSGLNTRLKWEVHLMVNRPEDVMDDYCQAGAFRAVFHYEAAARPSEVIRQARALGMEVGLAINPETPVSAVTPLLSEVDSVLLLSVNPGFYGSPFIPEVLDKVAGLRAARPDLEIGVDGGIKETNILAVARMGVDVICVGSAVFLQPDPAASFRRLQSLADEASG